MHKWRLNTNKFFYYQCVSKHLYLLFKHDIFTDVTLEIKL
jgi:hypothetical protein